MSYQINQLGKDQDVVAQTQAIAALEVQSQISFSIVNALNNILCDSKALWRVRSRHCLHWLTLHLRYRYKHSRPSQWWMKLNFICLGSS
ncbi:transcription initiation factor TFIID subunit 2-like isoform X2 [Tripterygium wilfordii]|uniref:transcription initiation factor TFIID subunit 2-like isoform X2 n=1 Tax=Tripterygium wilfordii TaxID=458696 RepID=UPI0018F84E41|nr:transcription initiation factor TFIID subunit 2-like isoform X2 [Tripterygium wilfordii]